MRIELHEILLRDVVHGYVNSNENGVVGYGGKLNVRPQYQREFVYKDAQRNAVIDTVKKGFPLNVMYWIKNEDGTFELLDGQQRTISICEYFVGNFSVDHRYFYNFTETEKERFLNYKLMVYVCEGNDKEKLDWFRTINIAGEKLFDQELLNAMYTGPWLTDAKRHFSKTGCPAVSIGKDYMSGTPIRQEYLETALDWISSGNIQEYMAKHQRTPNANELWLYFQSVINWVKAVFPVYRKEMKSVAWGTLYNKYKDTSWDTAELEKTIDKLMQDDDVTKKSGAYEYVLSGEEKHLSLRAFTQSMKRSAFTRQRGKCPLCEQRFEIEEMEADHITPWHAGGRTVPENCQMLCKACNRRKSGK